MSSVMTLDRLTTLSGLSVLDHLDRSVSIPILDGPQAQGDLIVLPRDLTPDVHCHTQYFTRPVPPTGLELLRSAGGGNPHTLVAEGPGCGWGRFVIDPTGLALGIVETTTVAYLIHPEHGATGIAPGSYVIRRQREHGVGGPRFGTSQFVVD
ncbi:hypothetical protein [Gordonia sp. NPDC003376]